MMKWSLAGCAAGWALWLGSGPAAAQSMPIAPRGEFIAYPLSIQTEPGESGGPHVAFADMVSVPRAAWIRLYFSEVELERGSMLRVTSMLDGETQTLDAAGARMWGNTTAYFNGDRVLVELVAGHGTQSNRAILDRVAVEFADAMPEPEGVPGQCGICGTDDRVLSNDNWAGRLMPVGCTASVINTCSGMVSAGHCVTGNMVVQFNVPPSQSNCNLVNPPVNDQFPISAVLSQAAGVGADWAVLQAGSNGSNQKPYDRYEQFRRMAQAIPAPNNAIAFWGFGVDASCINTQRQQYASGTVSTVFNSHFDFVADIRSGTSGSAIVRNGEVIGVITHCTPNCPNKATRWDLPAFVNARNVLFPNCSGDVVCNSLVDIDDLISVLHKWGPCAQNCQVGCAQDIGPGDTHDCEVNLDDVLTIVEGWGMCQ